MTAERKWTRNNRLAALTAERGLSTTGFRRSLMALVEEFVQVEERDFEFEEWFGDCHVVPAAHRVRRNRDNESIWNITVEVYEVEGSIELPLWKWRYYGDLDDRDGPHFELHILDKYDHEIVISSGELECFWMVGEFDSESEHTKELMKRVRSRATVQHHAPVIIDDGRIAEREREISALKQQLMKIDHSHIAGALQEIIYGLGLNSPHKDIAQRANVSAVAVRATARLLTAKKLDPREIVRDTHARWKAAYDAVRELGIQL